MNRQRCEVGEWGETVTIFQWYLSFPSNCFNGNFCCEQWDKRGESIESNTALTLSENRLSALWWWLLVLLLNVQAIGKKQNT